MLPNKEEWTESFLQSDTMQTIKNKVIDDFVNRPFLCTINSVERPSNLLDIFEYKSIYLYRDKFLFLNTFYYIEYMLSKIDGPIYDIGCGDNIYATFYPVIGIDPVNKRAQIVDFFDEDYAAHHKNMCNGAIAICSLHYIPITSLSNQILTFSNIIKPKGLGYITFNLARLLDNSSKETKETFGLENISKAWNLVESEFDKLSKNETISIINYELTKTVFDDGIEGNIRVLFEVNEKN